jgi:transcriptional regulator with XRE-family HTH domain
LSLKTVANVESAAVLPSELEMHGRNGGHPHSERHRRRLRSTSENSGSAEKTRLAAFLRVGRNQLGLTQQSLAQKLGVRASHIALLENGRRRPSLSLIARLAAALTVDGQELLELAYPEIKSLLSPIPKPRTKPNSSWQRLFKDKELLARYRVTRQELEVLERLSALGGTVTPKRLLAILLLARDTP